MLELILVPLDGSRFAEQALPHAIGLARGAHAKLRLVCVRPSHWSTVDQETYLTRIAAQLEPELPDAITHRVLIDGRTRIDAVPHGNACARDGRRRARKVRPLLAEVRHRNPPDPVVHAAEHSPCGRASVPRTHADGLKRCGCCQAEMFPPKLPGSNSVTRQRKRRAHSGGVLQMSPHLLRRRFHARA